MAQTYTVTVDERSVEVEVSQEDETFLVKLGDHLHEVSLSTIDTGRLFSLLIDGLSYEIHVSRVRKGYAVLVGSELYRIEVARGRRRTQPAQTATTPDSRLLRSPMTGIVVEVAVQAGQAVERGAVLLVLESMKMNNELRAERDGIVERVQVHTTQKVERGDTLLVLSEL